MTSQDARPDGRPDPDDLLKQVQQEELRARRGKLKIFFGFAPGVGKTYRMLQAARDLIIEHKTDVVVGIVEDHRRSETAAMVLGLELLPRVASEYRGRTLHEFDLEAALRRKPALLVIDELAHTNAPGSRHAKRWQDVQELLDAGIDIYTTVNVQHIESLNDIVSLITRVQVRETVPDAVIDEADAIELVDLTPEELLQRLREGKVYLGDQATRAAEHFFQRGNLLALRELALRRTAQYVDEDVRAYRQAHGVATVWPAGERVLVCVGAAPNSGRLVRTAARLAAGLRCPWVAAYVDALPSGAHSPADQERLETHLRLAESLGADVQRLAGASISEAILQFARNANITRIIVGKPTHARIWDRVRGSLLDEIVRGCAHIDVHVIGGDPPSETRVESRTPTTQERRTPAQHYTAAAALTGLTLGLAIALQRAVNLPDLEMLFLLSVMISAVWLGRGPAIVAAGLSVAAYDFFFVPPYYTFSVSDRRYLLTFGMMFGVGYALSTLANRMKQQEREATARESRMRSLYALSRDLAQSNALTHITTAATIHAAELLGRPAFLLRPDSAGQLQVAHAEPSTATFDSKDASVAQWCWEHMEIAGRSTDTLPGARLRSIPLRVGEHRLGVVAFEPRVHGALTNEQRALLDVYSKQTAAALERHRLADEASAQAMRAKTEELRASLLSAVSHDLRTPLASITGAATSLRDAPRLSDRTQKELIDGIVEEAERLERLVANLLDMSRLESGAIALRCDWIPPDEIIGAAVTRLESKLALHTVRFELEEDAPLLWVDPVLLGQVLVNLLENACKYTAPQSTITIRTWHSTVSSYISVTDDGSGIAAEEHAHVFEKFYRVVQHQTDATATPAGAGLGLAICKSIIGAHAGTLLLTDAQPHGACFTIELPRPSTPPVTTTQET